MVVKKKDIEVVDNRWKLFDTTEELFSALLGLGVVIFICLLLFNYFRKNMSGRVDVPGVTDTKTAALVTPPVVTLGTDPAMKVGEYVVVPGDSLWKLAEKYMGDGFKWSVIAKENNLAPPYVLEVGQKLTVNSSSVSATVSSSEYVVAKGDGLSQISKKLYGSGAYWVRIYEANRSVVGPNPNVIYAGTKLVIPKL
jgi:nucleoid-associated protein YgaU